MSGMKTIKNTVFVLSGLGVVQVVVSDLLADQSLDHLDAKQARIVVSTSAPSVTDTLYVQNTVSSTDFMADVPEFRSAFDIRNA